MTILDGLLPIGDLHMNAKKKFYELDKPFVKFDPKIHIFFHIIQLSILSIRCDCHKFEMIETEIKMLKIGARDSKG